MVGRQVGFINRRANRKDNKQKWKEKMVNAYYKVEEKKEKKTPNPNSSCTKFPKNGTLTP